LPANFTTSHAATVAPHQQGVRKWSHLVLS